MVSFSQGAAVIVWEVGRVFYTNRKQWKRGLNSAHGAADSRPPFTDGNKLLVSVVACSQCEASIH